MDKIVRYGLLGILKPEKIEEYDRLHENVWPEIKEIIRNCHLHNYSIFRENDMVFSYYEYDGDDYEADMQKMADNPKNQQWWRHTIPCFKKYAIRKDTEFDVEMKQIFYLE